MLEIVFYKIQKSYIMSNILKLALIGGAAYLAYDYWKKRQKNGVAVSNGDAKAPVSDAVLDAEMQEEGEEGMAVAEPMANASGKKSRPRFGSARIKGLNKRNGWDSNSVSFGM